MAYLCVICEELLTGECSRSQSSSTDPAPTALNCGHVFHQHCIRQWFDGTGGLNQQPGHGSCPKCSRISSVNDALRLFPEVESTSGAEAFEQVKALTAEKEKLVEELSQATQKLEEESDKKEELAGQLNRKSRQFKEVVAEQDSLVEKLSRATQSLEEVTSNHELLQLEHAEALSTVDSLNNDLQEKKDIIQAMEESAKGADFKWRGDHHTQAIDDFASTSSRTGDDDGDQSQEPPPKRKKTGPFRFTALDHEILKCFVSKEKKDHPWAKYARIADTFIKSDKYKEMIHNRGTEPSRSTLEKLVADICKGTLKENASKGKEDEAHALEI